MTTKYPLPNDVLESFANIPVENLLATALGFRALLPQGKLSQKTKDLGELVTQADLELQKIIIEYFESSSLAGSYYLKSEEAIGEQNKLLDRSQLKWQLVIDPLDGTNSFARGESDWGIMIGLCDLQGNLIYSWNLISTGEIYSTANLPDFSARSLNSLSPAEPTFTVDVFDYGSTAIEEFPDIFQHLSSNGLLSKELVITSFPSAVITAWEFANRRLDALVWVSSDKGKRIFPDYDLIFTGALAGLDAQIGIGWAMEQIQAVVVARSVPEFDFLWQTAISLLPKTTTEQLICNRNLKITTPVNF